MNVNMLVLLPVHFKRYGQIRMPNTRKAFEFTHKTLAWHWKFVSIDYLNRVYLRGRAVHFSFVSNQLKERRRNNEWQKEIWRVKFVFYLKIEIKANNFIKINTEGLGVYSGTNRFQPINVLILSIEQPVLFSSAPVYPFKWMLSWHSKIKTSRPLRW